jgi:hypothetical protein
VVTRSGRVYATQNGANGDWGDAPSGEGPAGTCTNEPRAGGTRDDDTLHLVERGSYGGHPNPTRARTSPRECDYVPPAERSALATFPASTNGLAEYRGDLVTASLDGRVYRLDLDEQGSRVISRETLATLTAPLDVTAQGDDDVFPGTLWVAQYTARAYEQRFDDDTGAIAVLEPGGFERSLPWQTLPRTGLARQEVSFVEAGGRLFLAGGDRRQQAYDPRSERWLDVAPLPQRLDHVQGVAIDGRVYYVGGLTGWPGPAVGTVDVYDPAADAFTRRAAMERPRGAGGVAVAGGRIYYLGGLSDGEAVPWADVYDPANDRWERLPDMPRARDHFQSVVVGDRIYAIGGRDSDIGREIAETDAFDVSAGRWVTGLAPIPTRRGGYAAAVVDEEILVIGGETARGALATVEAYRPDADAWRRLPPMTTARHGIQAALCGGAVYVAAGGLVAGGNAPTDDFEAYVPEGARGCGDERDAVERAGFVVGSVRGVDVSHATTLQFGPDGRLYVGQEDGLIHVYGVVRRAPGRYDVVSSERIDLVQRIPNHDDDGGSAVGPRALLRVAKDKLGL